MKYFVHIFVILSVICNYNILGPVVTASLDLMPFSNTDIVSKSMYFICKSALRKHTWSGLHLGNDSRGDKIRFYESEGSDSVKVCVHKTHGMVI